MMLRENFPEGNIYVRLVMDSKAIRVKPSRDLYSAVSFTDRSGYSQDQTSLVWDFAQIDWTFMASWGY